MPSSASDSSSCRRTPRRRDCRAIRSTSLSRSTAPDLVRSGEVASRGGAASACRRPSRLPAQLDPRRPLLDRPRRTAETLQRPQRGLYRLEWTEPSTRSSSSSGTATGFGPPRERIRDRGARRAVCERRRGRPRVLPLERRVVEEVAVRGDLARPPAPPLILASTSPQRHAILAQLGIPFDVGRAGYVEEGDDPLEHAAGKARSVDGEGRPCSASTRSSCAVTRFSASRRTRRTPSDARAARGPHARGRVGPLPAHSCVGGARARGDARVVPPLTPRDIARYLALGEWEGRAGAYAIQGAGASLVERIDGDYLNVVGSRPRSSCGLLARAASAEASDAAGARTSRNRRAWSRGSDRGYRPEPRSPRSAGSRAARSRRRPSPSRRRRTRGRPASPAWIIPRRVQRAVLGTRGLPAVRRRAARCTGSRAD